MQQINLQVYPRGVNPIIQISQYDKGRQLQLNLYDGANKYNIPAGSEVLFEGQKPDGTIFSYVAAYAGNVVTISIAQQATLISGRTTCELRILNGDSVNIGTINFTMYVEASPVNGDYPVSETDIPAIIDLGQQYAERAEDAAERAEADRALADEAATTAQNVLDSIPEDYQELSDNFEDLNNKLQFLSPNLLDWDAILVGKYMQPSGSIGDNPDYGLTDYIPIPAGKKVVMTHFRNNTRASFYFRFQTIFDKDKNVLSSEGSTTLKYVYENTTSELQYARFSLNDLTKKDYFIEMMDASVPYDDENIENAIGSVQFIPFGWNLKNGFNKIYVSSAWGNYVAGLGVNRFLDPISAHNSITDSDEYNKYKIIIYPGTYDFGGIWTGTQTDKYVGILLKNYVWIESYNYEYPGDVVFKWYGEDDFAPGITIPDEQAMRRCPIHITQNCQKGGALGIKFDCKNVRYCLHPETNATVIPKTVEGYMQDIYISNCIFRWNGRPDCEHESNNAVACGLEPCSKITFFKCRFGGYLGFHNNNWHYGTRPDVCIGSHAKVESCVFEDKYITYSVLYSGNADTYEVLEVLNSSGLHGITIGDQTSGLQKLTLINIGNQISGSVVNPFE